MGRLNPPKMGTIYLDASPVIYTIEKVEPYASLMTPVWQSADRGNIQLFSSQLLLLEVLVQPVRNGNTALESSYRQFLTESEKFELYYVDLPVLEKAIQIRSETGLKTPDAIHAATALLASCELFLTNDAAFKRVSNLNVAVLKDFLP